MTAKGAMEKSGCVRVIEGKEVKGNELIEYFLPAGVVLSSREGNGN